MPFAWVAFDVDGTLYDSSAVLVPAYERALACLVADHGLAASLPLPALDQITALVGRPNLEILAALYPELPLERRARLDVLIARELSALVRAGGGRLYAGALDLVSDLRARGRRLVAISNGNHEYLEAVFACYDLARWFEPLRSLQSEGLGSKAELLGEHLARHRIAPGEIVMVGDRSGDRDAARAVGCSFVGCLFGYASERELGEEPLTIRSLSELLPIIAA